MGLGDYQIFPWDATFHTIQKGQRLRLVPIMKRESILYIMVT
jgi:hypothetical protein